MNVTVAPPEVCVVLLDTVFEPQQLDSASFFRQAQGCRAAVGRTLLSHRGQRFQVWPSQRRSRGSSSRFREAAQRAPRCPCRISALEELRVARLSLFVDHPIKLISVM